MAPVIHVVVSTVTLPNNHFDGYDGGDHYSNFSYNVYVLFSTEDSISYFMVMMKLYTEEYSDDYKDHGSAKFQDLQKRFSDEV